MKNIHIAAILGGGAAFLYFATRGKKAHAATNQPPTGPSIHDFEIRLDPSGGRGCFNAKTGAKAPLVLCSQAPEDALEGYFSTSGYFSTGAVPCCSNCAHGAKCSG